MEKGLLRLGIFFMISLLTFIYCGGNNGGDNTNNSIKLSIQVPSEISTTEPSIQSTSGDIKTITITVEGSDFSTIEESFNFPGQIRIFVPIGTNRTFRLLAFDASGQLIFRGTAEGVTISVGENTVTITLIPVVEVCDNGIDDDGDGLIDCADPDCNGQVCDSGNSSLICVNHQCGVPATPPPSGGADLSITKSDRPDPVAVGNSLTYILIVRNNGPSSATGVSVTDTLPLGVKFISSSATQGICSGTSVVTCNVGNLAKGASVTITIVVNVMRDGTIGNTADITGNETDPNLNNNTATSVTNTVEPDLVPSIADPCGLVVTVRNQGDFNAPTSTTRVTFFTSEGSVPVDLSTPALSPGASVDLGPVSFPSGCFNPDCNFTITVDINNNVDELNEGNNSVSGFCPG
ncbi:MAG: CARDB domain-containing protein [Ignavibacteriales bacterium]